MTNISFIIPCGRIPFNNSGKLTVDSILEYHPDAEIIVSSKEFIDYKNIIYIEENKNNFGAVEPINNMAKIASKNFICVLNDDFYIKDNLNPIINYIEERKYIGLSLKPIAWDKYGWGYIPSLSLLDELDIPNMPFPIIKKDFIIKHNQLLYNKFSHHYADCALAFIIKWFFNQEELIYDDNIYAYELSTNTSLDSFTKKNKFDSLIYQQILCSPERYFQ